MRIIKRHVFLGCVILGTGLLGCGASPAPVAKPGPPAPPPPPAPVVVTPAPAPTPPVPAPLPVTLPPELIAKADELIKLMKPPAATGDALDQAVAIAEQQAKAVALSTELPAMVAKLTPEQQALFMKEYQSKLTLPTPVVPATPATPPANP